MKKRFTLTILALTTAALFIATNLAANTGFDQSPGAANNLNAYIAATVEVSSELNTAAPAIDSGQVLPNLGNELNNAATATVSPGAGVAINFSVMNPSDPAPANTRHTAAANANIYGAPRKTCSNPNTNSFPVAGATNIT